MRTRVGRGWLAPLVLVAVGAAAGSLVGPAAPAATAAPGTGTAATTGTAASTTATVRTGGGSLNVRRNASTWRDPVGRLADGSRVTARCQLGGERVAGRVRDTAGWLEIGDGRFISDAYVAWRPSRPTVPWCDQPAGRVPTGQAAFVTWAARHARASRDRYRVPVSVAVAQAINESGWGRSQLTRQGNAFFGIKCFGTPGPIAVGCRPYPSSECDRRGCFPATGQFRVYPRPRASFLDHGRFLTVNPRYRPAFEHTDRPNRFARAIHRAGYATDPAYADKLIALMREHDLYRFDR